MSAIEISNEVELEHRRAFVAAEAAPALELVNVQEAEAARKAEFLEPAAEHWPPADTEGLLGFESLTARATATTQVLGEMLTRQYQHRHWGLNE